jgi:hypothetical protein
MRVRATTDLLRDFSSRYSDISTAHHFGLEKRHDKLNVLLLGIHGYVTSFADNRSTRNFGNSTALRLEYQECKAMLRYWFHAFEAVASGESQPNCSPSEASSTFDSMLFFHFISMMLHIPIHDIDTATECTDVSSRNAAITRLMNIWNDQGGKQAYLGLWNAEQIIRIAEIMINSFCIPLWVVLLLKEVAKTLGIYSTILYPQKQHGIFFNQQHIRLDPEEDWHIFSISILGENLQGTRNSNGDFITLHDPRQSALQCAQPFSWFS